MKPQRRFCGCCHYVTGDIPAEHCVVTVPSDQAPVTDSFAELRPLRELQSERTNHPVAAVALAINSTLHDHGSRGWCSLRLAGDPLHLPLLQAVLPTRPPLLAFRSADAWARCLLRRECDAVLLPQAGMAADPQTAQPPKLSRALRSGVELIALGQPPPAAAPSRQWQRPRCGKRCGLAAAGLSAATRSSQPAAATSSGDWQPAFAQALRCRRAADLVAAAGRSLPAPARPSHLAHGLSLV